MPTTTYLSIRPVGDIREVGPDDNERSMFTTDYLLKAQGVPDDAAADVAQIIVDAGLGTLGTDLFIGRLSSLPHAEDADPIITLVRIEGLPLELTHNFETLSNPGVMVSVRSVDGETAMQRARDIYKELPGNNVDITRT